MNNEETIIAHSENHEQNTRTQKENKKNSNGKTIAAAAASATLGGVAGGAGTAAAMNYYNAKTEENEPQEQEQEQEQVEAHTAEAPKTAEAPRTESKPSAPSVTEDDEAITPVHHDPEPDHTAAPINVNHTITDEGQPTAPEGEQAEVQVLGVYEHVTEDNVQQTAAVLTDGTEVAVVVDVTGNGMADVLAVDNNHNNQIDDGEVVDISDQDISMRVIEQAYLEQQQMDDLTSNASSNDQMLNCNDGIDDGYGI